MIFVCFIYSIPFSGIRRKKNRTKFQWIIIIIFRWMAARMAVTSWSFHWFGLVLAISKGIRADLSKWFFSLSSSAAIQYRKTNASCIDRSPPISTRARIILHALFDIWSMENLTNISFSLRMRVYANTDTPRRPGGSFSVESFIG